MVSVVANLQVGYGIRVLILFGVCAVLLGFLVSPVVAAPGGNAAQAAQCQDGGYLTYTRADGTPFKNAGQCTAYAAQGNALIMHSVSSCGIERSPGAERRVTPCT
jgi:hypothetical protein